VQIKIDTLPLSSSCAHLTSAAGILTYRGAHVRLSLLQRFSVVLMLPIEQVLPLHDFCLLGVPLPGSSSTLNKYFSGLFSLGVEFLGKIGSRE
jgi:hypothetical protein